MKRAHGEKTEQSDSGLEDSDSRVSEDPAAYSDEDDREEGDLDAAAKRQDAPQIDSSSDLGGNSEDEEVESGSSCSDAESGGEPVQRYEGERQSNRTTYVQLSHQNV